MVKILALTVSIVFIASTSHAASFSSNMGKAGKYYKEGKYNEALESYDEALLIDPNDPIAQYNRAVVLYSKEDFTAAEEAFLNTLASGDEKIEEFTVYNTGNSKYRGSEKLGKSEPSSAIEGYKKTLEYYKRAMELSPGDMDAKYNYELTVKKIEEIEQQQQQDKKDQDQEKGEDKKEQQDQQQKQDEKEQEEKQQDRQQTEQEKKEQQQKEKEKQEQKEQEEKEKRKSKKDKDQEKKDQQDRQQTSDDRQQTEQEMSKEEAEMLLRTQKEEENRMRLEQKKAKRARRPIVLRDW